MTKKLLIGILLIVCMPMISQAVDKTNIEKNLIELSKNEITLVHRWLIIDKHYSEKLICATSMPSDGKSTKLIIYKKKDDSKLIELNNFSLGGFPYFIKETNHNLVVICDTAVGYLVYVFNFKDGVVKKIIDDGSYLPPEFVYLGDEYKNALIVPIFEWTKKENESDEHKVPVFANVYILNKNDFHAYKKIPWKERYNIEKYNGGQ